MRAVPLGLREGDRETLTGWGRARSLRAGLALRARIVLWASEGVSHTEIAQRLGVSRQSVVTWRGRSERSGLGGLADRPRSGRPRTVDRAAIITATLRPPPRKLGARHWSSRLLAERLGIDHATVARAWAEYGVTPWRCETFKFCTDPELVAKVTDVVGLYLAPPGNAIVLCCDEKSRIQALDRTAPMLPMQPGRAARWTPDYRRHSTTTLCAALEIATGKVTAACKPRHRHQESERPITTTLPERRASVLGEGPGTAFVTRYRPRKRSSIDTDCRPGLDGKRGPRVRSSPTLLDGLFKPSDTYNGCLTWLW
jgi:transposase